MALNIKVLGQGTMTDSAQTDYELLTLYPSAPPSTTKPVPPGKAVIVKTIRLVSSGNRVATINYLAAGIGQTNRAISPKSMALPANALVVLDDELTMTAGDRLLATVAAASGTTVDFVISGVERDQA